MLKYNPFKPGSIIHPGMFAGRYDELVLLEKVLFQTLNGNPAHFLIHGERGIGKSSLLLLVDYCATGAVTTINDYSFQFFTVGIELEPNDTYNEIICKIAREMTRKLDRNQALRKVLKDIWKFVTNWEVLGVKYNRETTPSEAMLEELSDKIAAISKVLAEQNQGFFLFIDEADKPPSKSGLGEIVKVLTERLTKKGANNVGIGVVGISSVIRKMRESHQSSVRIFTPIELTQLLPEERKEVVEKGLTEANEKNTSQTVADEGALDLISELSEGYPHFIQQYAYSAFEQDSNGTIDAMDVISGLLKENGALHQLGMRYFENMYSEEVRSDDYRTVLQVVAQHHPDYTQRKTIIKESGLKSHTVDNALAALKKRGSLTARIGQRGQFRLPSQSFAAWIKAFKIARKKTLKLNKGIDIKLTHSLYPSHYPI